MADLLQDYFNRITALNRQRGMTGNMQYGRALDASLAEGYFDAAMKNKSNSQAMANQRRALDIQQQGMDVANRALDYNQIMGWAGLGANLAGRGAELYLGRQPKTDTEVKNTPTNIPQNFQYQSPIQYASPIAGSDYEQAMMGPESGSPWGTTIDESNYLQGQVEYAPVIEPEWFDVWDYPITAPVAT
jgi:hypothetical protein